MKSTVTENPCKKERKYPCLKQHPDGTVILFTDAETGVALKGGGLTKLGDYSVSWNTTQFSLLKGSVCLENSDD